MHQVIGNKMVYVLTFGIICAWSFGMGFVGDACFAMLNTNKGKRSNQFENRRFTLWVWTNGCFWSENNWMHSRCGRERGLFAFRKNDISL